MNLSRRLVIGLFCLVVVGFLTLLFWPFVLQEIIQPISLAVWLFLRIFVLSIGQKYYWAAMIFAGFLILYRLLLPAQSTGESPEFSTPNETLNTITFWRRLLLPGDGSSSNKKTLRRELARQVVALYATKQRTSADFRLFDALQKGEIPLPENIHTYLFMEEPQEKGNALGKLLRFVWNTPRKLVRSWTGQETADHYRMIEEVLGFIESSLEMKDEHEKNH